MSVGRGGGGGYGVSVCGGGVPRRPLCAGPRRAQGVRGVEGEAGPDVLPGPGGHDEARSTEGRSDSKLIAHVPDDVMAIMNGSERVLPGGARQQRAPLT